MKINRIWRKVTESCTIEGKPYLFTAWGGSRDSEQEAKQNAQDKLKRIIENFNGKQALWAYDYAHSEIREPIQEEDEAHGESPEWVITRNRYGALVLNISEVVFIDVDCSPGGCFALWSLKGKAKVLAQINKTIERDDMACRVYETYAGYRIVCTDKLLKPEHPESIALMQKFKSDKLYATLCLKHECYRARLSPKPFRLGVEVPKLTVENVMEPEMQKWIGEYEGASKNRAVCKLILAGEDHRTLPEVKRILEIHDRYCLSGEDALG